jgi:hypothetical protein
MKSGAGVDEETPGTVAMSGPIEDTKKVRNRK